MKYIITIAGIVIFLSSCATQKRCERLYPATTRIKDSVIVRDSTHIIDSIVQKTVTKDSVIYIKAVKDSGEVSASENHTYRFNNGSVSVVIKIKDGKVKWNIDQQATISRFQSIIDSVSRENSIYKAKDSINSHKIETIKDKPIERKKWYAGILEWIKNGLAIIGFIWLIVFIFTKAIARIANL
jgi:hypothetical protein